MPNPIPVARLTAFCQSALREIGADAATVRDCTASILHGSLHGVDSHGVRLLPHYIKALEGGRLNKAPILRFTRTRPGSGMLHGDNAQGAVPTYAAVDHACALAREAGIGAVGITHSSHFGPAGAYSLRAAQLGMMALVTCNSDSFVRLHDGAERFHGTNPLSIACAAPENPWLLDMATSAVPYNRVELYRSTGTALPDGVASDSAGADTTDPHIAEMLAPLGGTFGFKGAALGGVAELLSAVMTGSGLSPDLAAMAGPDFSTPRGLGAFVIVLDPDAFAGAELVRAGIIRYLTLLRTSPARPGSRVMAPGDREWTTAARRSADGITLDPVTAQAFDELSQRLGLPPLADPGM